MDGPANSISSRYRHYARVLAVMRYSCTTLARVMAIGASATAVLAFRAKPRVISFRVSK